MYSKEFRKSLEKEFHKLAKKNPQQLAIVHRKINEILQNPNRYKNLRHPLQYLKRVHIDKSFVLLFSIDKASKKVIFERYDHHDNIYL